MPENRALELHFAGLTETPAYTFFSGFTAALRDARKFTNRNQDSGEKLQDVCTGDLGSWLGAIGYLSLLDQIGKCFKPRNVNAIHGNSIIKALKYFSQLSNDQIDAIYALRCAFAHDFSLFNINANNPSLTHFFIVNKGIQTPIVTLPVVQWNGNHNNRTAQNVTRINLEQLGDLVENICSNLKNRAQSDTLEIALLGGSDELIQRYSFYTRRH
jgi:hypothetical protein